jgi:ATP-dependent helicase/DNAse subunit B
MTQLGLDRLELEEEIQRYQFMRIISSAKQVHLVYQDRKDKEKSRFIEELIWEDALRAGKNLDPVVEHVSFAVKVAPTVRSASKTAGMLEQLRVKRYSPSVLNAYLKNPYGFYMDHVLALRENEDLLDEPEGRQIGIFIHELLKEVYLPLIGKQFVIDDTFEARAQKICDDRFAAGLARSMRSEAFLVKAVIDHRLKVFLERERERAAEIEELLGVEWPLEGEIPMSVGMVSFKCVVDRVERRRDGSIVIMDYKTGGGEQCPKKSFSLTEDLTREGLFKDLRSFQLPLYFYFVSQKYPQARLLTEIHNLREAKVEAFPDAAVNAPHADFLVPFLNAADFVIAEILDPAKPFLDDDLRNYD